jgi:hypothetical protein
VIIVTTKSGEIIKIKIADSMKFSTRLVFDADKDTNINIEKANEPTVY